MATGFFSLPRADRASDDWSSRSLRSMLVARRERNRADLPLLSVARERGVFVRSADDANHNTIPEDLSNYKVAREGDLVVNKMKAWQGSLGLAPVDGIVSPAYFVFATDFAVPRFGEYLLRSKPYVAKFGAASDGVRIGQWDLSIPRMRNIEVLLPPAEEQAAIVKYLAHANARIDKAIAAKRRLIALLEEQKTAEVASVFASVERDDVPLVPLKRLVYLRGGMTPSKENPAFWGGSIPWISPKDVKVDVLRNSIDRITQAALAETSISLVPSGALAVVVRGMILARTVPVAVLGVEAALNQDMKALTPRAEVLDVAYLRDWFQARNSQVLQLVETAGHGTKKLDTEPLLNLRVRLPKIGEQAEISERVESEVAATNVAVKRVLDEIALLQEFRTRLVADVVTGQVDVRAIAATLPEAPVSVAEFGADSDDEIDETHEEEQ